MTRQSVAINRRVVAWLGNPAENRVSTTDDGQQIGIAQRSAGPGDASDQRGPLGHSVVNVS
jgi:hypothetical protein